MTLEKSTLTCILLVLMSLCGSYQDRNANQVPLSLKLSGTVIDKETQEPLSYASIFSESLNVATVANRLGEFEFAVAQVKGLDSMTVEFRFLGFKSRRVPIREFLSSNEPLTVELTSDPTDLGSVVIREDGKQPKAEEIVAGMVKSLSQNFNQEEYALEGYFRQISRDVSKDIYYANVEAQVGILHDGKMQLPSKISINQARVLEDYNSGIVDSLFLRSISMFLNINQNVQEGLSRRKLWRNVAGTAKDTGRDSGKESADSLLTEYQRRFHPFKSALMEARVFNYDIENELVDPGKWYVPSAHYATNLHDNFLKRNVFKTDSILYDSNDLIYKIRFIPKNKGAYKHLMQKSSSFVPVGYVYIRDSDYSLAKFSLQFVAVSNQTRGRWTYKMDLDFFRKDGNTYPYYLKIVKKEPINADAYRGNASYVTEKELLTTKIITDPNALQQLKSNWQWNSDLYSSSHKYDSVFWSNRKFIKETLDQIRLRKELEIRIDGRN